MNIFDKSLLLKQLIKSKNREIKMLRELAESIPCGISDQERVMGGMQVQSKFADIMDKVIDLENTIVDEISEYLTELEKVHEIINQIPNLEQRLVMQTRYIEGLSFSAVAKELNYSERHVYNLRKNAVEECIKLRLISPDLCDII